MSGGLGAMEITINYHTSRPPDRRLCHPGLFLPPKHLHTCGCVGVAGMGIATLVLGNAGAVRTGPERGKRVWMSVNTYTGLWMMQRIATSPFPSSSHTIMIHTWTQQPPGCWPREAGPGGEGWP